MSLIYLTALLLLLHSTRKAHAAPQPGTTSSRPTSSNKPTIIRYPVIDNVADLWLELTFTDHGEAPPTPLQVIVHSAQACQTRVEEVISQQGANTPVLEGEICPAPLPQEEPSPLTQNEPSRQEEGEGQFVDTARRVGLHMENIPVRAEWAVGPTQRGTLTQGELEKVIQTIVHVVEGSAVHQGGNVYACEIVVYRKGVWGGLGSRGVGAVVIARGSVGTVEEG